MNFFTVDPFWLQLQRADPEDAPLLALRLWTLRLRSRSEGDEAALNKVPECVLYLRLSY